MGKDKEKSKKEPIFDDSFDYSATYYQIKYERDIDGRKFRLGLYRNPAMYDPRLREYYTPYCGFKKEEYLGEFYMFGDIVLVVRVPKNVKVMKNKGDTHGRISWYTTEMEIIEIVDKVKFLSRLCPQEGDLRLDFIESLKNVKIPRVKGDIHLPHAKVLKSVVFDEVGGDIYLHNAIKLKDVKFLDVKGNLHLNRAKVIKNTILPRVGGNIYLQSLRRFKNVGWNEIGGNLYLPPRISQAQHQ